MRARWRCLLRLAKRNDDCKYYLQVTDRAGNSAYVNARSFSHLLTLARNYARDRPSDVLCGFNDYRADYDWNGLSEREVELFDEAVEKGLTLSRAKAGAL